MIQSWMVQQPIDIKFLGVIFGLSHHPTFFKHPRLSVARSSKEGSDCHRSPFFFWTPSVNERHQKKETFWHPCEWCVYHIYLLIYHRNCKFTYPGKLTWNLQIIHLERKMIFQTFIMFQPLIFRGVPLGPQTTNLWSWLELKHPKFLGCLSWVGNWSNLRNLQRIFWLEGSYPGLNYDSGKDGMKDLIVHHWVGWTMIQFFYKPDDVLLTQLSFGKKVLRNAPGKGEIILYDLGLFPVCFYRFYHREWPLSHHVGNMFLPSTLSESKMNLIACVEMSFCHNTVCTVWQDFWDGTLQEGCKWGKNLKGGSGASTTAVVGVVFVQQRSSEVLMWEGFWLLQIYFLYLFVDRC